VSLPTLPPLYSHENERATLGAALSGNKIALRLVTELREEDFDLAFHRRTFQAIAALVAKGSGIDPLTVWTWLHQGERPQQAVKEFEYLGECTQLAVPSHFAHYAEKVREFALRRALLAYRDHLSGWIYDTSIGAEQIPGMATLELLQMGGKAQGGPRRLLEYGQAERERLRAGKAREALLTGIDAIDTATGGLERGETGLIVGRPGKGKSVALVQLAMRSAEVWGPTALVSLEMSGESLWDRMLAGMLGMQYREIRDAGRWELGKFRHFTEAELGEIDAATQCLSFAADRVFLATSAHELDQLIFTVQRLRLEHGIEALFIDYGGLIVDSRSGKRGKAEEMTGIAIAVKQKIAVQMNMPVWVGIQATSDVEKEGTKQRRVAEKESDGARVDRPIGMGDVSWAQQWVRDASLQISLNPDPSYAPRDTPEQRAMFWSIPKARNAANGLDIPMWLRAAEFRFTEREAQHTEADAPPENRRWN